MIKYFLHFYLMLIPQILTPLNKDITTFPSNPTKRQNQYTIKNFEHIETLHDEYTYNDTMFYKELARMSRMMYQSTAGYALYITITYIGKITNTADSLVWLSTLYAFFFAINMWEAGKSAYRMITCIDKTQEIDNKIAVLKKGEYGIHT